MKCPNCGNYVHAFETIDSEWIDNEYYDTVSAVREKYKDIDHSSYSGELESDELNAARREYVDKLNGLLLEKLGSC